MTFSILTSPKYYDRVFFLSKGFLGYRFYQVSLIYVSILNYENISIHCNLLQLKLICDHRNLFRLRSSW